MTAEKNESAPATVQVGAAVPLDVAKKLRAMAKEAERSQAAELRLAVRAWIEREAA